MLLIKKEIIFISNLSDPKLKNNDCNNNDKPDLHIYIIHALYVGGTHEEVYLDLFSIINIEKRNK